MPARSDDPAQQPDETPDDGSAGSSDEPAGPSADRAAPAPVDDEQWARIVAELGRVDSGGPGSRDEDPDAPRAAGAPGGLDFSVAPGVESPRRDRSRVVRPAQHEDPLGAATGRDWDGTSQYDDAEDAVDAQETFVPPDPGPVLGGDPLLTMAWFGAAGMPLLLLVIIIAWRDAPAALVQAACIVFVLGVAVLVWRMPSRRDEHDDDGAVV